MADWTAPPASLSVPALGEVHVWRLDLSLETEQPWRGILAPDELARADRFHFARDRHTFTVTRGVLRTLLGRYVNAPPESLFFTANRFGKPLLDSSPNRPPVTFNVTHSGGHSLLAFGNSTDVGVDVERETAERDMVALTKIVFSPSERERFLALPDSSRTKIFFQTWTAKEAIVKALGGGLSIPVDQIEIAFRPDAPDKISFHAPQIAGASECSLRNLAVHPGYAGALAVRAPTVQVRAWLYRPTTTI